MSPLSVLSRASLPDQDRSRLYLTLQVSSLRQAALIAAQLGTMAAELLRVRPPAPQLPGRRDWTVVLTTPPLPLTLAVIRSWEEEMLAVEHRWPGSHFLGWTTCSVSHSTIGERDMGTDRGVSGAGERPSQRELVTASLLRNAPPERRGIVHGRGAPR